MSRSNTTRSRPSIDRLPSFSIANLQDTLSDLCGYRLADLESKIRTPDSYAIKGINWTREGTVIGRMEIKVSRDPSVGLMYVDFYDIENTGVSYPDTRIRYYLQRVESNLIPGTYRYYFVDPYSESGLCSKIYLFGDQLLPGRILRSRGFLYKQQREGHTERYVWTFYHRVPDWEDLKYRKTHYRGIETPFWRRYEYMSEEGERRVHEYFTSLSGRFQKSRRAR